MANWKTILKFITGIVIVSVTGLLAFFTFGNNSTTFFLNLVSIKKMFVPEEKPKQSIDVYARATVNWPVKAMINGISQYNVRMLFDIYVSNTNYQNLQLLSVYVIKGNRAYVKNTEYYVPVTNILANTTFNFQIETNTALGSDRTLFLDTLLAKSKKSVENVIREGNLDVFLDVVKDHVDVTWVCNSTNQFDKNLVYSYWSYRSVAFQLGFSDKSLDLYCFATHIPFPYDLVKSTFDTASDRN